MVPGLVMESWLFVSVGTSTFARAECIPGIRRRWGGKIRDVETTTSTVGDGDGSDK